MAQKEVSAVKGLEFNTHHSLQGLLDGICLDAFDWYIFDDEIIVENERKRIDGYISVSDLKQILSQAVIIFMNLQAFPKGTAASKVQDHSDLLQSPCRFAVLVTDVSCVEIYAKNDEDLLLFLKNAERCQGENIMIKTEAGAPRKTFCIS